MKSPKCEICGKKVEVFKAFVGLTESKKDKDGFYVDKYFCSPTCKIKWREKTGKKLKVYSDCLFI